MGLSFANIGNLYQNVTLRFTKGKDSKSFNSSFSTNRYVCAVSNIQEETYKRVYRC